MHFRFIRRFKMMLVGLPSLTGPVAAQVVLQTQDLRLEIGTDGLVTSLKARASGSEYASNAIPMPFASVYRGGQMAVGSQEAYGEFEMPVYRGGQCFPASAVSLADNRLKIRFDHTNLTAIYQVTIRPHYLAFKLHSLEGDPIDRIDLVQIRVRRLPFLGPWINVAYDDQFGICLCTGNIRTNAAMTQYAEYVDMRAIATREVALKGATAVLFGCQDPKERFLDVIEVVERYFQMPSGAKHRRAPSQKYSYLWCSPTPSNIDQYIAVAKRAGFRMILFSYTSFTRGAGHFLFNDRYPNGIADLKRVTDRIRDAGKLTGAQRTMLKTLDPEEHRYVKVWYAVFLPQWVDAWSKGTFNDQEHHLFLNERGEYELVPIHEVPAVAGGRVKAFIFQRSVQPDDTYVILWARRGELSLTLPVSPNRLAVMRPFGTQLSFDEDQSSAVLTVGIRRYLRLAGVGTERALKILTMAK